MMQAYITGIGWITGAGFGWGSQGGECNFSDMPLPLLTRKDVFPAPNQRFGRMSEYAKLGLAAITFALRDAGLESWEEKRAIGAIAVTRFGCLATDLDYNRTVLLEGGGLASPNLFAYTLANCFLGDAAIHFGLTGSLLAINESGEGALGPLRLALDELALGETETILAGCCDLSFPLSLAGVPQQLPGALFMVLTVIPQDSGTDYGTVFFSDDGRILHNGFPVSCFTGLLHTALALRTSPTVVVKTEAAPDGES